ncbi:hypothetical protein B7494_g7883 [Chlorociboria aeruginascens]|nr:hypothetical protein B7494_g7883 [Chlorociboria aeruginascens]
MAESSPKPTYSNDPALYLYTSLTSGSSHIVTATSRLETILKANRIPFKALDIATDEKARMLWGRRAGKDESGRVRKLPGLVQMGLVIGDLVEIEDWNEYGELKLHVTIVGESTTPLRPKIPTPSITPSKSLEENKKPESNPEPFKAEVKSPAGGIPTSFSIAMKQAGEEAARKAKDSKKKPEEETFDGTGEAEPKDLKHSVVIPPPVTGLEAAFEKHTIEDNATLQSPTSTAWKRAPGSEGTSISRHTIDRIDSLQSPNSTAWKPTDVNLPVLTHKGSNVSTASAEVIKQIEDDETIEEGDEEEDE